MPYEGSLALHTGENSHEIVANRKEIAKSLGVNEEYRFIVANQTHSDHIELINEKETRGWETEVDAIANCDALITDQKGVVLTVMTADCVPILLLDRTKEVVAVIHAGWKGTRSQIATKTVQKMQEIYSSKVEDIIAFIGPAIGRCCYEVGEDVAGHFTDQETYDRKNEKYMLDLPLINQKQLLNTGIKSEHIELSGICTSCESERFFSYRKEYGCSGRFMSMIALKN